MITNLRLRLPGAQFSGISLNCDNFIRQHSASAFPLCVTGRPFYRMSGSKTEKARTSTQHSASRHNWEAWNTARTRMKEKFERIPVLGWCLKTALTCARSPFREIHHCVEGYRFLRKHDLLIVSGGGQLDEEWGGAWGHPFALFKWAVLARIARTPFAMASVGACKARSTLSRFFLSGALRLARYRSYRDKHSREIVAGLLQQAAEDTVVPDLALGLPSWVLPPPVGIRSIAQGRTIVAISPIAFAKPGDWPYQDRAVYDRYLQQVTRVVLQLLERECFLVIVWSSLGDRESVVPDLLRRLEDEAKQGLAGQIHIPRIATWKDLVAVLQDVDFLVASRLHSAILGFLIQRPTVAISFDPKVDWVMEDVEQTDYLLQLADFAAEDVINTLDRIALHRDLVKEQLSSYGNRVLLDFSRQYDVLATLATARYRDARLR